MKNILDYLAYFGNESFDSIAFNDIDSLILTQLVYAKLKDFMPDNNYESKKIVDVCSLFLEKYSQKDFKNQDYLFPNSYKLIVALQSSERFMNARISNYVEEIESKNQFGAMTVRFPDGLCYVAFEGTDSSIVGWLEDLELIYKYPIISHKRSISYLEQSLTIFDRKIYLGGHSKGGNIAMYAYMNSKYSIRKRIKNVYNFDGPGFLDDVIDSELYKEMLPKLKTYIPEQAVVGLCFGHPSYNVVKSFGMGILQHDAYTWCVFGGKLEIGNLSKKSRKFEKAFSNYLNEMSFEEKKIFVATMYQVFENLGITNVMQMKDISITRIIGVIRELRSIPNNVRKRLVDAFKLMFIGEG